MSDAKQVLDKLEEVNGTVVEFQKRIVELEDSKTLSATEAVDLKATVKRLEDAQVEKGVEYDALIKKMDAEKSKTKLMDGLGKDESHRKQFIELFNGFRQIAKSEITHFDTNEFKSLKEARESKSYNSGDDTLGGAALMPFVDSQIDKLVREFSDVRSLVTVSSIATDKYEALKMNQGNGATWEKDMADYATQTKNNTLNKLSIMVNNLHSIAVLSDDLINDEVFNFVGELLTSMAEDFAIAEATSFWTGDGVGELSGVLNAPVVGAGVGGFDEIERVATAASTSVTLEDIYTLVGALKDPYLTDAQFKANRLGIVTLRKIRSDSGAGAGTGQFLWQPSNQAGIPATLAGYPISQATELSSTIEAANAEGVVFGSFRRAYRLIDRSGLMVLRDNLTQYPNIAYKAKKRVGGGVQKGEALKILKTTA